MFATRAALALSKARHARQLNEVLAGRDVIVQAEVVRWMVDEHDQRRRQPAHSALSASAVPGVVQPEGLP